MHEQPHTWTKQRRGRNRPNAATSKSAIALCTRHLSDGSLIRASRAALLAQRLMRLETEQAERARKQDAKHAIERGRAEAALAQAHRAVASLDEPPKPRHQPLSDGELHAMLARLPASDASVSKDDARNGEASTSCE